MNQMTVAELVAQLSLLPPQDYVTISPTGPFEDATIQFVDRVYAGDGRTWLLIGGDYMTPDTTPRVPPTTLGSKLQTLDKKLR